KAESPAIVLRFLLCGLQSSLFSTPGWPAKPPGHACKKQAPENGGRRRLPTAWNAPRSPLKSRTTRLGTRAAPTWARLWGGSKTHGVVSWTYAWKRLKHDGSTTSWNWRLPEWTSACGIEQKS